MTMEMAYQLIEQLASAGATGQTGAKRDAGTQNKSDGGFDTMVRQKQQEAKGASGNSEPGSEAPAEAKAEKPVADGERLAMAAAMLLQPQPVILYEQSEPVAEDVSGLVPEQAVIEIAEALPEQAAEETVSLPEQQEILEAPAQTFAQQPEEAAAQDTARQPEETARVEHAQAETAPAAPVETAAEKVEPDRHSGGAELSADNRESESEAPAEQPVPDAPVFGYMDASPVRVAAPETAEQPLDPAAPDAAEELAARIESALTDETGATRVELSLSPASLGKLTVEITRGVDGSLHVQLFAATGKAAALLEKNALNLQNLLAARERSQTTVEVRVDESARQQFLDPNGQRQNRSGADQQQQQQQRKPQQEALRAEDFMSRLRLGLVELDAAM